MLQTAAKGDRLGQRDVGGDVEVLGTDLPGPSEEIGTKGIGLFGGEPGDGPTRSKHARQLSFLQVLDPVVLNPTILRVQDVTGGKVPGGVGCGPAAVVGDVADQPSCLAVPGVAVENPS